MASQKLAGIIQEHIDKLSDIKLFEKKPVDAYGGTRYLLRNSEDKSFTFTTPFLSMSTVNLNDKYAYLFPQKDDDVYKLFVDFLNKLEDRIKTLIPELKLNLAPIVKSDSKFKGLSIKFYSKYKDGSKKNGETITTRFIDGTTNEDIDPTDIRLVTKGYSRISYSKISVDSVYLQSSKQASVQLKVIESVLYITKSKPSLDLDLIKSMRAVNLQG